MYRLYAFGAKVVPHVPIGVALLLGRVMALVAWMVAGRARRQVTANIEHVLGRDIRTTRAGRRRLRKTVRGIFQHSMRNYLEAFYLPYLRPSQLQHLLEGVTGLEYAEEALAKGKGVILISAHIGPFEYLVQWFSVKGYAVTIPVERLKDERMLDLMLSLRRGQGVNFTPLGGSAPLRAMIAALHKNELVLITGDRAVVGGSVERVFFGEPARLPSGPVELAMRTGAAIVFAYGWREGRKGVRGHFVPVSLALPEEQRGDAETLHGKVIAEMEEAIRAHAEQWVVFEQLWEE